jgi:hypothetical protein
LELQDVDSLVVCVHKIRIAEDASHETVLKRNNVKTELAQKRSIKVIVMNAMKNVIKAGFIMIKPYGFTLFARLYGEELLDYLERTNKMV